MSQRITKIEWAKVESNKCDLVERVVKITFSYPLDEDSLTLAAEIAMLKNFKVPVHLTIERIQMKLDDPPTSEEAASLALDEVARQVNAAALDTKGCRVTARVDRKTGEIIGGNGDNAISPRRKHISE